MFRYYRSRGWSCIPILAGTKKPAVKWEQYQKRHPTQEEVEQWAVNQGKETNDQNLAIVCGQISGLIVLDVDINAPAFLQRWPVPDTVMVETEPGEKLHIYFQHPGFPCPNKLKGEKFFPDADLRGDGGYVLAPPSRHHSGSYYKFVDRNFKEIDPPEHVAPAPPWLLQRLQPNGYVELSAEDQLPADEDWIAANVEGVEEGRRNDTLTRLVGHWFGIGHTLGQVTTDAQNWSMKCSPPLSNKEVQAVVQSIWKKEQGKRRVQTELSKPLLAPDDRRERLASLGQTLGMPRIVDIRKTSGEDPMYTFEMENGATFSVTCSSMSHSCTTFRAAVQGRCDTVTTRWGSKTKPTWDQVLNWVEKLAVFVDSGEEATVAGEIRLAVSEYLRNRRPQEVDPDIEVTGLDWPFVKEGKTYLVKGDLLRYLHDSLRMKIGSGQLAQRLRMLGAHPYRLKVNNTQVRAWHIPWFEAFKPVVAKDPPKWREPRSAEREEEVVH